MTIIDIFLLVLIIVAIVLFIYLIISLKKINITLDYVQKDLSLLNEKLAPILENISIVTEKAVKISDETEKRVLDISESIQNVKKTVAMFSFKNSGTNNYSRNPVTDLVNNLTAISKGVATFWSKLK